MMFFRIVGNVWTINLAVFFSILLSFSVHGFSVKLPFGFGNGASGQHRVVTRLGSGESFNPFQDFLSRKSPQQAPEELRSELLLEQLGLERSTEPKTFGFRLENLPNLLTASIPALLRAGSGVFCQGYRLSIEPLRGSKYRLFALGGKQIEEKSSLSKIGGGRPRQQQPLILYYIESCPYCRKVQEAISILSLEVTFLPCPKNGVVHRQQWKRQYGRSRSLPFLVDPNTAVQMMDADKIVNYLFRLYSGGTSTTKAAVDSRNANVEGNVVPWTLTLDSWVVTLTAALGLVARWGKGQNARPSNPPPKPIVLWAYEGSPFCKVVREVLCELELAHTQVPCPRGSPNRQRLFEETKGRFQVPYMQDSNTGISLFESEAIQEYLEKHYGVAKPVIKFL